MICINYRISTPPYYNASQLFFITQILYFSYSRYSERDSHRSEGEYEEERYVDRKEYDGKWADGNEPEQNNVEEKPAPQEQPPKE